MNVIKVVIVDDSILMQSLLCHILHNDPDILIVGMAENPLIAKVLINTLKPDVLILDVEIPRMDGITFLKKLMQFNPMPVIMCSAFTQRCNELTMEALRLGVIDIITKPIQEEHHSEIINKVKYAALTNHSSSNPYSKNFDNLPFRGNNKISIQPKNRNVIAIGASTGSTEALKSIINALPSNMPPILVTQYLPKEFCDLFVSQVNVMSKLTACQAQDEQFVEAGHDYFSEAGSSLCLGIKDNELCINFQSQNVSMGTNPSIDMMMESVAKVAGNQAIGIVMSGIGSDGANGLLALKNAGGITIAQEGPTSVTLGMPKLAIDLDAVSYILPLQNIAEKIVSCVLK